MQAVNAGWNSASTSRTSALCLLKNFPQAQQAAEVRHYLPGAGAEVKASPCVWHPGPGIPSCVPSIASHLLMLTGLGCHSKQAEMVHAIPAAWYTSAIPPATACLHPSSLCLPPQPAQPIQQPRNSPVGTSQRWQLLSALAGLVQRSLIVKFYCGN